jgi:hypothetical protein
MTRLLRFLSDVLDDSFIFKWRRELYRLKCDRISEGRILKYKKYLNSVLMHTVVRINKKNYFLLLMYMCLCFYFQSVNC